MANWAYVEKGEIFGVYDELPPSWKNISNLNAITDREYLKTIGWFFIVKNIPIYNELYFFLDNPRHTLVNDIVYEDYDVKEIPIPLPDYEKINAQWVEVRAVRDKLMADFEWRYTRNARETRAGIDTTDQLFELDKYMQDLADITKQVDPFNIVWPVYKTNP